MLQMIYEVVQSGARGATIGRNIWGFPQITAAVLAFKSVIHEGLTPEAAMRKEGLL
jgi:class I fructose-bisphosphate aldolase